MADSKSFADEHGLLPGDLLLFVASPKVSLLERFISSVELLLGKGNEPQTYYHVAVYVGNGNVVEAVWPRAHKVPLYLNKSFDVYRLKDEDDCLATLAAEYACKEVGEYYDIVYFCSFGLWKLKHAKICSSLAWTAYKKAGKELKYPGKFITPEALGASPDLKLFYKYRIPNGK